MQDVYNSLFKDENGDLKVFSVSEISNILKQTIENGFSKIRIRGEITGLKKHQSGHYYFDLKEKVQGRDFILNGVIWKWTKLPVEPEEGLEVIIDGKITVYTGRSSYQVTVEKMEIAGEGALLKLIEERKKKLAAEGLFDADRKKELPMLPKSIGVITSETGAVIQDIMHRIKDRFPTRVILWPVAVQGDTAHNSIAAAIKGFDAIQGENRPEVLIVARGGGSLQDLMPFNEEIVVRAAAECSIPLISAVGHETDTTLIDYASDRRAPTPTGAAEIAVPVRSELLQDLANKQNRLDNFMIRYFEMFKERVINIKKRVKSPMQILEDITQRIVEKQTRINNAVKNTFEKTENKIKYLQKLVESYSFKKVLKRGYAVVWGDDKKLVSSADKAKSQKNIEIEFYDGKYSGDNITVSSTSSSKKCCDEKKIIFGKKQNLKQDDLF
jgi:exodeoxyribonuclease VII large subunit